MSSNDTEIIGIDSDPYIIDLTIVVLTIFIDQTVFVHDLIFKIRNDIFIIYIQILSDPDFTKLSRMKFIKII